MTDWRWYYTNDLNGPSTPVTYLGWAENEPSNANGRQDVICISKNRNYDFNDISVTCELCNDAYITGMCFLCECP